MANELQALDRRQLIYENVVLLAGQTLAANVIGVGAASPMFEALGMVRLLGNLVTTTAPAAGFPRIRLSTDGVNFDEVLVVKADPNNALMYPIDFVFPTAHFTLDYTDGGAGATVKVNLLVLPEA